MASTGAVQNFPLTLFLDSSNETQFNFIHHSSPGFWEPVLLRRLFASVKSLDVIKKLVRNNWFTNDRHIEPSSVSSCVSPLFQLLYGGKNPILIGYKNFRIPSESNNEPEDSRMSVPLF